MKQIPHTVLRAMFVCTLLLLQCANVFSENISSLSKQLDSNISMVDLMNSTNSNNTMNMKNHRDYIVKFSYILNEVNIITPYIRDELYYNHNNNSITTGDIIDLFNLEVIDFNETQQFLRRMNISEEIFKLDNFKLLLNISDLPFSEFYDKLKDTANLNGPSLQEALQVLNISVADFSTALAIGGQDDVWRALSMGNYTVQNFEEAAQKVNTTLNTFYNNTKRIILNNMRMKNLSNYVDIMRYFPEMNKNLYDNIWKYFNLTIKDIYRVQHLKNLVENVDRAIKENTTIGVVISNHEIIFHKELYKGIQKIENIIFIYAESLSDSTNPIGPLISVKGPTESTMLMWSNKTMESVIELETLMPSEKPKRCSYINSVNSTHTLEYPVEIMEMTWNKITLQVLNISQFTLGNPLICDGKLFGLASRKNENNRTIEFDTFFIKSTNVPISNSGMVPLRSWCFFLIPLWFLFTVCC